MLNSITDFAAGLPNWLQSVLVPAIAVIVAVAVALLVHRLAFLALRRLASSSETESDNILVTRLARPTRYAMVALAFVLVMPLTPVLEVAWTRAAGFVMPALIGWIALAIMRALFETMALRADTSVEDNLRARQQRTRLAIFGRIGGFVIVFVTVGLMMLAIPGVRNIGVTLVASAGLAGLAVGAAAQPALKSLIAGMQMALTEPIAIDDVVIVGGEWGWIEEIRTTYVVVKVWDKRRLVVPTSQFLDEIFENWTKTSADLIGTVFLPLDPATDIGPIREEYTRQITGHRLWDKQAQILQVTDATPDAIEVRLLMSAKDSPTLFDLRCEIREAMMDWIRVNQPEAIVRRRLLAANPIEAAGPGTIHG